MLSYHDWLEVLLEGRYVTYNCPEYIPALELTQPALISQVTHNWLYPFYKDNVPASEFHSDLYRLNIDSFGEWTLD